MFLVTKPAPSPNPYFEFGEGRGEAEYLGFDGAVD
jgi:hypothetical protein